MKFTKPLSTMAREVVSIAALGEEIKAHALVVNGFSKTFAMTGWRLGLCRRTPAPNRG